MSKLLSHSLALFFSLLFFFSQAGYCSSTALPIIVSSEALQSHNGENLVFVDVRAAESYQALHIDKAIHINIEDTFNRYGDPSRIAPLHQVQDFLSKAGITNRDTIVIYDNGDLKNAAHLFWLLESYSHKNVSVLDGGFAQWQARHGKVSSQPHTRLPSHYIASISPLKLATKLRTRLAIKGANSTIVDARSREEYLGLTSRASRKGHIPKAISIPWSDHFIASDARGLLKDRADLQKLYIGIDKNHEVISYCNRGKQSAVSYLVMRHLGYRISIYDGGWLEWGNDGNLPINLRLEAEK